ncbi:MAG: hypothetical protein OEV66_09965 [Spirochaetia bacterium]|nr:hypothetical protein [Spirochaetia bacterium]
MQVKTIVNVPKLTLKEEPVIWDARLKNKKNFSAKLYGATASQLKTPNQSWRVKRKITS